jgi:sec-independent protein translocase protein TatC
MVTAQQLVEWRRYFIVVVFVAVVLLAAPDLLSQLAVVIPLVVLYEIAILAMRRFERGA